MQRGFSGVLLILVVLLLAGGSFAGYYFFQKQQLNSINSFEECAMHFPVMESFPEQCNTPDGKHFVRELSKDEVQKLVPPTELTDSWKTYTNQEYGYQLEYPTSHEFKESKNEGYDYVDIMLGCVQIFSGKPGFEKHVQTLENLSFNQLSQLQLGQQAIYPEDPRENREDGSFIIKLTYKKLDSEKIGGVEWYTFSGSNNWENLSDNKFYFTRRNNNLYVLDLRYQGSCYDSDPLKVRDSFKFLP